MENKWWETLQAIKATGPGGSNWTEGKVLSTNASSPFIEHLLRARRFSPPPKTSDFSYLASHSVWSIWVGRSLRSNCDAFSESPGAQNGWGLPGTVSDTGLEPGMARQVTHGQTAPSCPTPPPSCQAISTLIKSLIQHSWGQIRL